MVLQSESQEEPHKSRLWGKNQIVWGLVGGNWGGAGQSVGESGPASLFGVETRWDLSTLLGSSMFFSHISPHYSRTSACL